MASWTRGFAAVWGVVLVCDTKTDRLSSHDGTTGSYVTTATTKYDDFARPTTVTNAMGTPTTTVYTDANGLNSKAVTTNIKGHATSVTYTSARHQPTLTLDPNNKKTELVYDALGRLDEVWLPFQRRGGTLQLPYYTFDYRVSENDPVAITTKKLSNDLSFYTTSIEILDGQLRSRQIQGQGPDGGRLLSDTVYDGLGRVSKTNDPYYAEKPPEPTLMVVEDGEVNGQQITEYDHAGRTTAVVTADAGAEKWRTTTSYGGDRVNTTPPEGGTPTTVITDARGNTTALRQYDGAVPSGDFVETVYGYTPGNQLSTVTDPLGNTWSYTYDQRGRKIAADDPDAGASSTVYNDLDQPTSTTDARGQQISTTYDELGRVTATYNGTPAAGTQLTKRIYDSLYKGQETSAIAYSDGLTSTMKYVYRDWNYAPTRTDYTVSGETAANLAGTYSFGGTFNFDGTVKTIGHGSIGGLGSGGASYLYDELGRATSVTGINVKLATDIFHEPTGQLSSVRYPFAGTTAEQTFLYEHGSHRLSRTWLEMDNTGGTIGDTTYAYDPAGNIESIIDSPTAQGGQRDAQCFDYDHLRRMTQAWTTAAEGTDASACTGGPAETGVAGAAAYWQSFTFDAIGNRKSKTVHSTTGGADITDTYTYPTGEATQPHALSAVTGAGPGTAYEYDDSGNTTKTVNGGQTQDFAWDPTGRLASVTTTGNVLAAGTEPETTEETSTTKGTHGSEPSEGVDGTDPEAEAAGDGVKADTDVATEAEDIAEGTVSFAYDANGGRIMRTDATGVTVYLPGVELHSAADTQAVSCTRYTPILGGATFVESTDSGKQLQFADPHGTGTTSIASTGVVTHRYSDPYGNPRGATATDWLGDKGFVGGTIDPTGLTHLGAREYAPDTGRFISADPIIDFTDPQQINGYAYASNNPTTFTDPDGLKVIGNLSGTQWAIPKKGGGYHWIQDDDKSYRPNGNGGYVESPTYETGSCGGADTLVGMPCNQSEMDASDVFKSWMRNEHDGTMFFYPGDFFTSQVRKDPVLDEMLELIKYMTENMDLADSGELVTLRKSYGDLDRDEQIERLMGDLTSYFSEGLLGDSEPELAVMGSYEVEWSVETVGPNEYRAFAVIENTMSADSLLRTGYEDEGKIIPQSSFEDFATEHPPLDMYIFTMYTFTL